MRHRFNQEQHAGFDEQGEVGKLLSLLPSRGSQEPHGPPDAYWSNLLVRTNRRIDDATSGKAISISWAARVAIPGVVAIISFLIGVYYYAPHTEHHEAALSAVVSGLGADALDSLMTESELFGEPGTPVVPANGIFDLSLEQIADYLIINDSTDALLETLSDQQMNDLLAALGTSNDRF